MLMCKLEKRGTDIHGSGEFGARRGGSRFHNGVDYAIEAGHILLSPVEGFVSKFGYPYSDDLSFRYVEITTEDGYKHRLFYVDPSSFFFDPYGGQHVDVLQPIGRVQDLTKRYPGITNYVHYEIKNNKNNFVSPETHFNGLI